MASKKASKKPAKKAAPDKIVAFCTVNPTLGAVYAAGVTPGFGDRAAARQLEKVKGRAGGSWSDAHAVVVDGKGKLSLKPIE